MADRRKRSRSAESLIPPPPSQRTKEISNYYNELLEYHTTLLETQERILALKKKEEAKHIWGLSNPLLFPARYYTKDVLEANQPFLRIVKKAPKCAVVNEDGDRLMDPAVIEYVMKMTVSARLVETEALYEVRNGEMTNRPWHLALIEGLRRLTTPSSQSLKAVEKAEKFREYFVKRKAVRANRYEDQEDEESDSSDSDSSVTSAKKILVTDSQLEDMVVVLKQEMPEAVDEDECESDEDENDDTASFAESMGQSHEEFNNDIAVKVRFAKSNGFWYCVLVLECKHTTTLTDHSIYQAVKYALDRALSNLNLARVLPVHVMVLTESDWTYGVLDVYGAVKLGEGGKLIYDGFDQFEKARWEALNPEKAFVPNRRATKEALEKALEQRRGFLRENSSLVPGIDYVQGTYLVADLFMTSEKYKLPEARNREKFLNTEALLFYEALLRIIVGDHVLEWTKKNVDKALETRDSLSKRMVAAIAE